MEVGQLRLENVGNDSRCLCDNPNSEVIQVRDEYGHEERNIYLCNLCECERREITDSEFSPQEDSNTEDDHAETLTSQLQYTAIRSIQDAKSKLKKGDHVAWERNKSLPVGPGIRYNHHAIVEKITHDELHVIHYAKDKEQKKFVIKRQVYTLSSEDMKYNELFCLIYPESLTTMNPPNVVIARAIGKIGKAGYNILFNNCESFASFCKRGVARSLQVSTKVCNAINAIGKELKTMCTSSRMLVWSYQFARAEGVESIFKLATGASHANLVGGFLYCLSEGFLCCVDIYKLFECRNDKTLDERQFRKALVQRVIVAVSRIVLGTTYSIFGGELGGLIGGSIGAALGSAPGLVVGATIGTLIGSVAGGVGGVAAYEGSRTVLWSLLRSTSVDCIDDLVPGDHVVVPGKAFMHPRCHAIISQIDKSQLRIKVIRNDFKRGVVEEWIDFTKLKRICYDIGECYSTKEVLESARARLGSRHYNIATYNCKTFAVEHKLRKELNI